MVADGIAIRLLQGSDEMREALALRERVFCGEQGVSPEEEQDGLDEQATHLVALDGGLVVGTLRVLVDGTSAKIGRVVVDPERRRRGIALAMLERALELAGGLGCVRARLAAQTNAIEVYRAAGFEVESDPFWEARIEHVWMGRRLDAS